MLRIAVAVVLALTSQAGAQTAFPTPGNGAANLVVMGCLNTSGQAVPCPSLAAGASVQVIEAAPVQVLLCPPNPISKKSPPIC